MATTVSGTKSCLSCPSYLAPVDAAAVLGKSTNAPMCARYGYPLGRSGATVKQNTETVQAYATGCPSFGMGRPTTRPSPLQTEVFVADPEAHEVLPPLDSKRTVVKSCSQCKNFVSDDIVTEATGWAAGACRAKGRLIIANQRSAEARSCDYRQVGRRPEELGMMLLPIYQMADAADAAKIARAEDSRIEPLEYPTDREVSDEEAALGIQAWRKIEDPEGISDPVFLPIFDPKSFTEEQRAEIPQTGDDEPPELYFDHNGSVYRIAVLWMELDETPAAWGQPGVGKTEIGRHLAWMMQVPFYRFSIKESTELYELEGATELVDGETKFRDGRLTRAWSERCVIAVDEPNMGRPEVWAFLRPLTDKSKSLVLDSDGGRKIPRNEFAFLILAMNPAWSPLNVGVAPIGAADASRLIHMYFDLPEEAIERQIVSNRVRVDGWEIDRARLDLVFQVSSNVRQLCETSELTMSWGIRENIKAARMLRWFSPLQAYRMAAADYLEPQQREALLDQVRAATSGGLPPVKIRRGDV